MVRPSLLLHCCNVHLSAGPCRQLPADALWHAPCFDMVSIPFQNPPRSLSMMHRKTASALAAAAQRWLPCPCIAERPAHDGNVALTTQLQVPRSGSGRARQQRLRQDQRLQARHPGRLRLRLRRQRLLHRQLELQRQLARRATSIESDIYGGYKFKAGAFDLDFGALTYIYPGNAPRQHHRALRRGHLGRRGHRRLHLQVLAHRLQGLLQLRRRARRLGPEGPQHRLPEPRLHQGNRAQGHAQGRASATPT